MKTITEGFSIITDLTTEYAHNMKNRFSNFKVKSLSV